MTVVLNGIEFPSGVAPTTAHVCVDDTCEDFEFETTTSGLGAYVQAPGAGAKVTVSVELRDVGGASIEKLKVSNVALNKAQPNGPKCEPTCFSNVVDFDPATRSLVGRPLQPDVRR